jgi:hypothetical protein
MIKWPSWVTQNLPDDSDHIVSCAMYQNVGKVGIAIVAVVSLYRSGMVGTWTPIDWAAYIGGSVRGAEKELWAIEDAVKSGNKLSRKDAKYFFPDLPMSMYRD